MSIDVSDVIKRDMKVFFDPNHMTNIIQELKNMQIDEILDIYKSIVESINEYAKNFEKNESKINSNEYFNKKWQDFNDDLFLHHIYKKYLHKKNVYPIIKKKNNVLTYQ